MLFARDLNEISPTTSEPNNLKSEQQTWGFVAKKNKKSYLDRCPLPPSRHQVCKLKSQTSKPAELIQY